MSNWEPKIVAFVCNWCTYAGADLAGVTRTQYRPNVRLIRVPCTGRVDPLFIIKAFEQGADGALISGCHPGDCHYISGNLHAKRRWIFFKGLTDFVGIEPERIQYAWVSASEANKWAKMVDEVTETIRRLGPFTRYHALKHANGAGEQGALVWNEAWQPGIPDDVPLPEDAPFVPALRDKARDLLERGEVRVVIGYGWAKRQRRIVPVFITKPDDVSRLVFNALCVNNLSVYLPRKQGDVAKMGRPAIVAKGCDVKTLTVLLQEEQIGRDGVVILGVSCSGVVYRQELWEGKPAPDLLAPKCSGCDVQTPRLADHLLGEPVAVSPEQQKPAEVQRQIEALDRKNSSERWDFWAEHFDRCIKCYACSQVCPLCYCDRCITEKNNPQWVETSAHPQGNFSWNLVRAIHLAGRCTYCGECDRVCPANIPLNLINRKLAMVSEASFGYRSGYDEKEHPPMVVFSPDDKENFIR
jgi:coenzyme F420-reducing hydrogenase delta subunit/ferredoxin